MLDAITEQIKFEMQTEYIQRVFKEALDPMDWAERVSFMRGALTRLSAFLPAELVKEPPERFARHYEEIARTYVLSLDKVKKLFRKL